MRMKGSSSSLLQSAYQFCTGVRSEEPSVSDATAEEEGEYDEDEDEAY